jgi:hypothetical protein
VKATMAGKQPDTDYDNDDQFNARMIQTASRQTYEQVEEEFENAREEIAGLIAELPDAVFSDPQIYDEFYGEIVTHYQQHIPPGVI